MFADPVQGQFGTGEHRDAAGVDAGQHAGHGGLRAYHHVHLLHQLLEHLGHHVVVQFGLAFDDGLEGAIAEAGDEGNVAAGFGGGGFQ